MLTPEEIRDLVETLQPTLDGLNAWITKDLIRRFVARMERHEQLRLTNTDAWQIEVYRSAGGHVEDLREQLAKFTRYTDTEIAAIFEDAGIRAYAADALVYASSGIEVAPLAQSDRMIAILEDTYKRTKGEVHNFTRTTATQSQKRLINALDEAHMKVYTGAQSYTAAVVEAVEKLATEQADVQYPSGHVDTLETAVLRAVRTGTAQASGNMAIQGMIDHDWDIILVSAHLGARYGDGGENPGNHFWWQGKFYSRTGRTPGLPLFEKSTGYGTGPGLSGWNTISTWNAMKSTIASTTSNMSSAVSTKFSAIQSTIKSKVNGAKSAITSGFESARSAMVSKMTSAMNTIKGQGWYSVGTGICSGIQSGLNAGWSWLSNTVSNLARRLLNSAKSALGIHSPSRVFRDAVGLNIGYGIGEGIERSEGSVLGSVTSVADAIAEEFNAGDYEAANIIPTTEINGVLTSFSDTITDGLRSLLDKLQAIAENVSFAVPVSATSLIPYSTSAREQGGSDTTSGLSGLSMDKLMDLLVQLLTNQTTAIVTAIQNYSGTQVNIDKDSLTTAVIEEINRRTRMAGASPLLT